jgi:hypothetical protein
LCEFDELAGRFGAAWAATRATETAAGTARQRRPRVVDAKAAWSAPILQRTQEIHWRHRRFNRLLASNRISVEHTLASVKRLKILRDEFRNRPGIVD